MVRLYFGAFAEKKSQLLLPTSLPAVLVSYISPFTAAAVLSLISLSRSFKMPPNFEIGSHHTHKENL